MSSLPNRTIGIVGLGYVGLPVAIAFAERFAGTIGFDISARRIEQLSGGTDVTNEVDLGRLRACGLRLSCDPADLAKVDFFIVAVPTPIDFDRRPDFGPLESATRLVGSVLKRGDIVAYESTVYPGVTEDICGPMLERESGLRCGVDFKLAYSPERIVPGDKQRVFETITKVVAGQDAESSAIAAALYGAVVRAGVHVAPTIKVAEAAKVIENTQRDLNIALMNELAMIFDKLGIDTHDVLEAAGTKWNFLRFTPGLVGGHCIGVDPYYLATRAEQVGVYPELILAARRANTRMGAFVAHNTVSHLIRARASVSESRVLVVGLTFKENVPDVRNTGVVHLVRALASYGVDVTIHDPCADPDEVRREYGLKLSPIDETAHYHAIVLAVPHSGLAERVVQLVAQRGVQVVIDVKAVIERSSLPPGTIYWRL